MPPLYYDFGNHGLSTNATPNTETARYLLLSPAAATTSRFASVTGLFANGQGNGAGGGYIIGCTFTTAGQAGTGTAIVPAPSDQMGASAAAASLTVTQTPQTPGTGARADRITVGFAQTGGQGGWIAVTPDAAKGISPGGGRYGNIQLMDLANAASQLFSFMCEFVEN